MLYLKGEKIWHLKENICSALQRSGQKGQIVIPKEAREVFNISPGDTLAVLGDINQGIGIVKVSDYEAFRKMLLGGEEK